jgi:hypothetical protein
MAKKLTKKALSELDLAIDQLGGGALPISRPKRKRVTKKRKAAKKKAPAGKKKASAKKR